MPNVQGNFRILANVRKGWVNTYLMGESKVTQIYLEIAGAHTVPVFFTASVNMEKEVAADWIRNTFGIEPIIHRK